MSTGDFQAEPHPVPAELEPGYPHALPPDHTVDPADVDEDVHPTSAWTVGERLDDDTIEAMRNIIRGLD